MSLLLCQHKTLEFLIENPKDGLYGQYEQFHYI